MPTVAPTATKIADYQAPPQIVEVPDDPLEPVAFSVTLPTGNLELTLEEVSAGGVVTVSISSSVLPSQPGNFALLGFYYEINAPDIDFGSATIRLSYRDEDVMAAGIPEPSLRLLHYENGQWRDITVALDTETNMIIGVAESFSPFVLGVQDVVGCAISINSGALFTAKLNVQVFSDTANAAQMLLANDAGFTGAPWRGYHSAVGWTINDPGDRIVTLLVYARLRDVANTPLCSGLTLSDDIFYDPLPPTVSASVQASLRSSEQQDGTNNTVTVLLSAADQVGGSGVTEMQVSTDSSYSGVRWQPFRTSLQVAALSGQTIHVRVRDGVGNVSDTAVISVGEQSSLFLPMLTR